MIRAFAAALLALPAVAASLTLADFEKMALAANPTMAEAGANVRSATGRAKQAGLYPNPTAGYMGEQIRGGQQGGGEQGFFVSQSIVMGGKLGAARRVADVERRQAETGVELQRSHVLNDIRIAFYEALAAERLVEVRREIAKVAKDTLETANELGNIGHADRPDILMAEVDAEQADLAAAVAEESRQAAWRVLAATAGKPDLPVARLEGNLEAYPDLDVQKAVDAALRESPAMKMARQDIERTQASVAKERKVPIPDLQIRGGLEQNFEPLGPGQRPIGAQGFAEIGIELPLFNRNRGNIEAASGAADRARQETTRVELELRREMSTLFRDYSIARATAERYKQAMLPRAQQAYDLYHRSYLSMAAPYSQVLIAQRTLFQLQADYVYALERVWRAALTIQGNALVGQSLGPVTMR